MVGLQYFHPNKSSADIVSYSLLCMPYAMSLRKFFFCEIGPSLMGRARRAAFRFGTKRNNTTVSGCRCVVPFQNPEEFQNPKPQHKATSSSCREPWETVVCSEQHTIVWVHEGWLPPPKKNSTHSTHTNLFCFMPFFRIRSTRVGEYTDYLYSSVHSSNYSPFLAHLELTRIP